MERASRSILVSRLSTLEAYEPLELGTGDDRVDWLRVSWFSPVFTEIIVISFENSSYKSWLSIIMCETIFIL